MKPPTAVHGTRLGAPPAAAWPLVAHSRFLADYLGARLPEAALDQGITLHGSDRDGAALTLRVHAIEPPAGLSLILHGSTGVQALHLALSACAGGSRLTITHASLAGDDLDATATGSPSASTEALATLLAAPLPPALHAPVVSDDRTLQAARAYLESSARAITLLRDAMPAARGYDMPAPGRFSLAAHVWHLADIEEFGWSPRLPRALAEHRPVLEGVDGDRLAIERRYQQRPWRGAAQRFVRLRRRSLQVLDRFDAAALARPLQFGGTWISAGELIAAMLAHDHEHRVEMAALWPPSEPPGPQRGP